MEENKNEKIFFERLLIKRKDNNIDLQKIYEDTKINIKYLQLIESGNFEAIPNIYVRLFIRSYAEFLNEDPDSILEEYEKHTNTKTKKNY